MVKLKKSLFCHFEHHYGISLGFYSMGRFDQKKTTRLHLDAGPSCFISDPRLRTLPHHQPFFNR